MEYEPACPEHSEHVYNPRTGIWEQSDPLRVQPSREDLARVLAPDRWQDYGRVYRSKHVSVEDWTRIYDESVRQAREPSLHLADAVLAPASAQPTVAEVRAQAVGHGSHHLPWRRSKQRSRRALHVPLLEWADRETEGGAR